MRRSDRSKKNAQIAASYAATKERRANQVCRVRTLKVQDNCLTGSQREALKMMFIEARWLTNAAIGWINYGYKLKDYPVLAKTVYHFGKDGEEILSPIEHLGSQVKQSIFDGIVSNIKALGALKERGHNVGRLKFRSEVKSVDLKQFGNTYSIKNGKLRIQGLGFWIKVNGLEQLDEFELANAKLLNTPKGYYLAVTCYRNKEDEPKPKKKEVGIDLGCATAVTLSDGRKFDAKIRESDRLKRLQKKLARQVKRSRNWQRTRHLIRVEYQKLTNLKDDATNKIVHEVKQYRDVYMQDEMIKSWHRGRFSKTVQHSILGRLKARLKPIAKVVLPASAPTTQMCYNCGQLQKMTLNRRVYVCDCGIKPEDRDVHSAKNMIVMGKAHLKSKIPVERRELKREERMTSALPTGSVSQPQRSTKRLF